MKNRKTILAGIFAALLLAWLSCAAHAQNWNNSMGMVLGVTGKARLTLQGGSVMSVAPMANLFNGDVITTEKDGKVTLILFANNIEYTIGPSSRVQVKKDGLLRLSGTARSAPPAVKISLPPTSQVASRKMLGVTLRGEQDSLFTDPADGGAILEGTHTFVWHFNQPPKRIRFILMDPSLCPDPSELAPEKVEEMTTIFSATVSGNSLPYPPPRGKKPLEEGKEYKVKVMEIPVKTGDVLQEPDEIEATFRVLTCKEALKIYKNREALGKALVNNPKDPVPLMMMTRVYIESGLYAMALPPALELLELMPRNPNAHYVLSYIYSKTGQASQATQCRLKAMELEKLEKKEKVK
jgi:hypothetical protein